MRTTTSVNKTTFKKIERQGLESAPGVWRKFGDYDKKLTQIEIQPQ